MAKGSSKTDDKIMALVEQELKKKPDATLDELMDKAKAADKSVGKLSKRQFNARYPLQIKRRQGGTKKRTPKRKSKGKTARKTRAAARSTAAATTTGGGREAVRGVFMKFASDMASAEARKDLVMFLAGIDKYVDEVMKSAPS